MIAFRLQNNIATFEKAMRHYNPSHQTDSLTLFAGRISTFILLGMLTLCSVACNRGEEKATTKTSRETLSVAETPLAKAAIEGDLDEIKALLDAGADIN